MENLRFGVYGAGSIGCYLGAHLVRQAVPTVLLGRERLQQEIRTHGLRVTGLNQIDFHLKPADIDYVTEPKRLADCNVILVTVKSLDTGAAGETLRRLQSTGKPRLIISFQNGLSNADLLRRALPDDDVRAGMVPYNVVNNGKGHFHCGTSGALLVAAQPVAAGPDSRMSAPQFTHSIAKILAVMQAAGLTIASHANLSGVLRGKLIFNLNNALNALAGIPLREELSDRKYRRLLADIMREALHVYKAAGTPPVRVGKMIPALAPVILGLPDWLFFRVAAGMIKIDPEARSSMWEDLNRGRPTEIDFLNGEIVRLAAENGLQAPLNAAIVRLIRAAEQRGEGSPGLGAAQLRSAMLAD